MFAAGFAFSGASNLAVATNLPSLPTTESKPFFSVPAISGIIPDFLTRPTVTLAPGVTYGNETLTEDTTWRGEVLLEGGVVVAPQATLTIEPGTIVRFKAGGAGAAELPVLIIQGRCVATGTEQKPVVFTSTYASPRAGDWQGVVVLGSEKKNLFEQCRFEGAVIGLEALYATLVVNDSSYEKCLTGARFQDCVVVQRGGGARDCGTGISLAESEADVRDLAITANRQGLVVAGTSLSLTGCTVSDNERDALTMENSRIKLEGNNVLANGSGVALLDCEGTMTANRLAKNAEYGLSITRSRVRVTGNEIAGNGKIGLRTMDDKGAAWGNIIRDNGRYDIFNAGSADFKAIGNWWGTKSAAEAGDRIYDQRSDDKKGRVLYLPILREKPQSSSIN